MGNGPSNGLRAMNTSFQFGTCSAVFCVLCVAATTGCGGKGAEPSKGQVPSILGRIPANHRASDMQCRQPAPAGTCSASPDCADDGGISDCLTSSSSWQWTCLSDGDCADAGVGGRCAAWTTLAGCSCTFDRCVGDSDCPKGQTCACHGSPYMLGSGNACVPGNCRIDADCGAGAYCSPTPALPCNQDPRVLYCQGVGYYCHTPKDECVDDGDCEAVGSPGCLYDATAGYWKCEFYARP